MDLRQIPQALNSPSFPVGDEVKHAAPAAMSHHSQEAELSVLPAAAAPAASNFTVQPALAAAISAAGDDDFVLGLDDDDEIKGLGEDEGPAEDQVTVVTQDGRRATLPRKATVHSGLLGEVFVDPEVRSIPVPHLGGLEVRLCTEWMKELYIKRNHLRLGGVGGMESNEDVEWMELGWLEQQRFVNIHDLLDRTEYTPLQRSYLDLDMELTFRLLLAAQYLDVKTLVATLAMRIALMLRGQSGPNILKTFGIDEPSPQAKEALNSEFKFLFA